MDNKEAEPNKETQQPNDYSFQQRACSACGSKELEFVPGENSLKCNHCGQINEVVEDDQIKEIIEHDFNEALKNKELQSATQLLAANGHEVKCENCNAKSVIDKHSTECCFCGSTVIVELDKADNILIPESILPFKASRENAQDAYQRWLKSRWFAPSKLKKMAVSKPIEGVYLPYWTFDSNTYTEYRGERGKNYKDSEGRTRTRWTPVSGSISRSFDDTLVCASESLPRDYIQELEPWDLHALKKFKPEFISGFITEIGTVDIEGGFRISKERMRQEIRSLVENEIGGDKQRIHSMNIKHSDIKFKKILLPVWLSCYQFKSKIYRFFINARTEEVSGERPYSWIKITFAALGILAFLATVSIIGVKVTDTLNSVSNEEEVAEKNYKFQRLDLPYRCSNSPKGKEADDSIYATSHLKVKGKPCFHAPEKLIDGNPGTAWVEGAKGPGIEEVVTMPTLLNPKKPVKIWAGYGKSRKIFEKNSRPKKIEVLISRKKVQHPDPHDLDAEVGFEDARGRAVLFTRDRAFRGK